MQSQPIPKNRNPKLILILTTALALVASAVLADSFFQWQHLRSPRTPPSSPITFPPVAGTDFGDPLPNLTATQLVAFAAGLEAFEEIDTPESGLGPVFNNVSCVACHSSPAPGGASEILETRFGRLVNGHFDPLTQLGGSLLQDNAIDPSIKEVLPSIANVVAHRQTTPLFGLGLIEAIPDTTILQNAQRSQTDGISGHAARILDVATGKMRIGRFGWKAQQATLLAFSGDAYLNEVGVTSRLFPHDNAPDGNTNLLALWDHVADPEDIDPVTGIEDIDLFTEFMRFLAPPPTLPLTQSARAGQSLFNQIGCANCHTPFMFTGPNSIKQLDRQPVALYSDLLLHDMGSLADNISQADASPREMKTPPLWGLRASAPYLHDGRAATVDAAIRAHDGEAARARARYLQLTPTQRQQLLTFLNSI